MLVPHTEAVARSVQRVERGGCGIDAAGLAWTEGERRPRPRQHAADGRQREGVTMRATGSAREFDRR